MVKNYRKQNRLSQQDLGDLLGVSQAQIARIENGKREVSAGMMRKLNALDPQVFPLPKWICPDCQTEEEAA